MIVKKEFIIGICLLAVIATSILILSLGQFPLALHADNNTLGQTLPATTSGSSEVAGRISHNINLQSKLTMAKGASETTSILIYKTEPPIVNEKVTLDYAKKFNVTGTLREGQVVQSKDLRYGVQISKTSGRVEYHDFKRPNHLQDSPDKLPTDDEAIKTATKFLKDRNLYPEGATEPVTTRDNAYTIGKGDEIYYGHIGVWYHRYLNGMKIIGTQLEVDVGGNGDVIGYYANWRNYTPYKEYPITTPQESFNTLKARGVPIDMNDPAKASATIDDVYLVYQTTPGAYAESYLQPVWVFKGNVMVDGKSVMPVEQYIPALTETPKEFVAVSPIATKTTVKPNSTTTIPQKSTLPASNATVMPVKK